MHITKAVIPCGGLGTRFLPITKALPKELLPIVDMPGLSYIVEEAAKSGITDVLLVLGENKDAIKRYFARDTALIDMLQKSGKVELAELVRGVDFGLNIAYAYQPQPKGSADAVYLAKSFTGGEPFCLAWGDDVICADPPVMKQLIEAYKMAGASIAGAQYFAGDSIVKYGVAKLIVDVAGGEKECGAIDGHECGLADIKRLKKCVGFVEKPPLDKIPSRYAALGRYVLTEEIYGEIEKLSPNRGELQLTDALNALCERGRGYVYDFVGKRYDCGDKLGYVKATVEYALKREFGGELLEYLMELVKDREIRE
ncbi:MAG: UTP--glucose-1-phosphate uridylyltransferase [Firmicutes bacterium]|nr:UTP--glucose-1-phosphate uridylyltransferase [Bacillota bacterium]